MRPRTLRRRPRRQGRKLYRILLRSRRLNGLLAPRKKANKPVRKETGHASRGRRRSRPSSRPRRHRHSRPHRRRRSAPTRAPLPMPNAPRPADAPPRAHGNSTPPSPPDHAAQRATFLSSDRRAFVEILMAEIESGVSARSEFPTTNGYGIRLGAPLLVSNGVTSLGELRITPMRNRGYLMEDFRKTGIIIRSSAFFSKYSTLPPPPDAKKLG